MPFRLAVVIALFVISAANSPTQQEQPDRQNEGSGANSEKASQVHETAKRTTLLPPEQNRQPEQTTRSGTQPDAHDDQDSDERSNANDLWGILLTFGLVVVGGLQVWVLRRQTSIIDGSLRVAEQSLVKLGEYVTLTGKIAEASERGTELTRQAFVLSNRPKINVRNLAVADEEQIFDWRSVPGGGNPITVRGTLRIFNVGDSPAHVVSWQCCVLLAERLPAVHPLLPLNEPISAPATLAPGLYGSMPIPTVERAPLSEHELFQLSVGPARIYILGAVVYKDDLGNIRTTWFCRVRAYGETRFTPVADPDYEYAE